MNTFSCSATRRRLRHWIRMVRLPVCVRNIVGAATASAYMPRIFRLHVTGSPRRPIEGVNPPVELRLDEERQRGCHQPGGAPLSAGGCCSAPPGGPWLSARPAGPTPTAASSGDSPVAFLPISASSSARAGYGGPWKCTSHDTWRESADTPTPPMRQIYLVGAVLSMTGFLHTCHEVHVAIGWCLAAPRGWP